MTDILDQASGSAAHPHTAPISYTMVVDRAQDEAFELFTLGMNRWWPRVSWFDVPADGEVSLDPKPDGIWAVRSSSDEPQILGQVLDVRVNELLVLAFTAIRGCFKDHAEPTFSTVKWDFRAEGETCTRIGLHHDGFHVLGEEGLSLRHQLAAPDGWSVIMRSFAAMAVAA